MRSFDYGDDGYDGVQHDDFYAPSAQQLEAGQIRRECAEDELRRHVPRGDGVTVTRPY